MATHLEIETAAPGGRGAMIVACAAFAVFLLLHGASALADRAGLWGVDQWRYCPALAGALLFVFGALFLVPAFRTLLIRVAGKAEVLVPARRARGAALGVAVALLGASGFLFWRFRAATHFLGDGYLWASRLLKSGSSSEPVSSFLYRHIFTLLHGRPFELSIAPVDTAAWVSIVSGLVFLVFAYKAARLVAREPKGQAFALLALLSCGTMQLFFGYVEAYPPLAAAVMAFTYYGMGFVTGKKGAIGPAVCLAMALALHLSAVALLPPFAFLFGLRRGHLPGKRALAYVVPAIAAGLVAMWTLQRTKAFSGFFADHLVPLFTAPYAGRIAYPLFSMSSLLDGLNELLLICPVVIFLPALLVPGPTESPAADRRVGSFLGAMAAFYALEFLVFNKTIGASRDWDIFAPMAIPLSVLSAVVLLERFGRAAGTLAIGAFALIVVHTAPWIGLNASVTRSETRFIRLVDTGHWTDYARGYGYSTLGVYFDRTGRIREALNYSMAATEADPGNRRYLYDAAKINQDNKQLATAARLYVRLIDLDPNQLDARNNLGEMYWSAGRPDLAEREFAEVVKRDSTYIGSYEPLIYAYFESGETEKCFTLYRKARKLGVDLAPLMKQLGLIP